MEKSFHVWGQNILGAGPQKKMVILKLLLKVQKKLLFPKWVGFLSVIQHKYSH